MDKQTELILTALEELHSTVRLLAEGNMQTENFINRTFTTYVSSNQTMLQLHINKVDDSINRVYELIKTNKDHAHRLSPSPRSGM